MDLDLCKIPTKTFRGCLMNTFFQKTARAMIANTLTAYPLLKLDQVIDWHSIEHTWIVKEPVPPWPSRYLLLSMFQAVLLGQWDNLSEPEHSLVTRIDFNLFCRFDELNISDYSTLCRYRNWRVQGNTFSELLELIKRQLTEKV